ncbi:MAG: hypothetical protein KJ077_10790 [Anaerolineae bacterium]|nr:hypothetical protein [Anaerolineae bacterium]
MEKVIFLDIDGVLINLESLRHNGEAHPHCVYCLNWLTEQTGAVIVVVSSMRKGGLEFVRQKLAGWGVIGTVIEITPELQRGSKRGQEIQAYLDQAPSISAFVILDDEADMEHLSDALVQTDYRRGLTILDARLARLKLLHPETIVKGESIHGETT